MARYPLYPLVILWGEPENAAELAFTIGRMHGNGVPPRPYGVGHRIRRWYGLSWKSDWFFGVQLLSDRVDGFSFKEPRP